MKRFFQLREQMSVLDAKGIFGVQDIPGADELKKLWKDLAMANHPDRGGDTETMKKVNQAYDVLLPLAGTPGMPSRAEIQRRSDEIKAEILRQRAERFPKMKKLFEDDFNLDAFVDYIQQFTSDPLKGTIKDTSYYNSYRPEEVPNTYSATATITNSEKTTYFEIVFSVSYREPKGGLGSSTIDEKDILYSVSYYTSIYHEKRKYKISQNVYEFNKNRKVLSDFEEMFPKTKLTKIFSGVKKAFKKADMLLALSRELDINEGSQGVVFIYPFGKEEKFYFNISRGTMQKMPYWNIGNCQYIDQRTQKYVNGGYRFKNTAFWFQETEEDLIKLIDAIKELRKDYKSKRWDCKENGLEICEALNELMSEAFPKLS